MRDAFPQAFGQSAGGDDEEEEEDEEDEGDKPVRAFTRVVSHRPFCAV